VIRGSLQLIPVGNSIIYVRPFYVRGAGSSGFPQFQFVAVFTQDKSAVCAPSVEAAIERLFDDRAGEQAVLCTTELAGTTAPDSDGASDGGPATTTTTPPGSPTTTTSPAAAGSVQALLDEAAAKLDQADQALAERRLGDYQTLVEDAQRLIEQAQTLQRDGG
jgi:uncharacterized membrane protein (UPF0182 family)